MMLVVEIESLGIYVNVVVGDAEGGGELKLLKR
jgi:hypothetical protein